MLCASGFNRHMHLSPTARQVGRRAIPAQSSLRVVGHIMTVGPTEAALRSTAKSINQDTTGWRWSYNQVGRFAFFQLHTHMWVVDPIEFFIGESNMASPQIQGTYSRKFSSSISTFFWNRQRKFEVTSETVSKRPSICQRKCRFQLLIYSLPSNLIVLGFNTG